MNHGQPFWVLIALAVATPLLAFGGALIGQVVPRKGAREQEVRWQREESMRILRWAAELAVDPSPKRNTVGVAALGALGTSALLQVADATLIARVAEAVAGGPLANYDEGDGMEEA